MYFGEFMWDLGYSINDQYYDDNGEPTNKGKMYSIMFNTFIFMQIFNFINSRKLGAKEFNVFSRFFNNWLFLILMAIIIAAQVCMVHFGGRLFRTARLSAK